MANRTHLKAIQLICNGVLGTCFHPGEEGLRIIEQCLSLKSTWDETTAPGGRCTDFEMMAVNRPSLGLNGTFGEWLA